VELCAGCGSQHDKTRELRKAARPLNARGGFELIEFFIRHPEVDETASDFLHGRNSFFFFEFL
jgi:hypothetical protein